MHPRDPVVGLCEVLLALAAAWACAVLASVLLELWRARAAGRRASVRRAVLVCCGIAMVAPAPGAMADDHQPPVSIAGLPMPDRATGPAHHRTPPQPTSQGARTVVVQAGDCLWHLAAADLPRDAGPDEIAARSRAIYQLNRTLIGVDPNLILPGQRLALPR